MKITKNFSLAEFNCKDGSAMPNSVMINIIQLAKNLQVLRDYLNTSITVNSGYRSPKYNARIGGVKNSQHVLGKAGDLNAKGFTPRQVADAIEKLIKEGKMQQGGIGVYPTFTHYDIRGTKARW